MAKLKTYKAKVNLLINGETVAPSETVELDKATAERMSAVLELTSGVEILTDKDAEKSDKAQIHIDIVVAAISELEVSDDNYTKGGKPDAVVLSDKLDAVVSAKLRDTAWDIYQQQQDDKGAIPNSIPPGA